MDEQKQNEVVVKIGSNKYNSTLRYLKNENNCQIFAIQPVRDVSSEGQLEIVIPGEEDGDTYGWKDKHDNRSKRTTLSTDVSFVNEDAVALQLDKYEKRILYTGKEYTLEGNINIVSSKCTGQPFRSINKNISPTCKIGTDTIGNCTLTANETDKKLNYKIKINGSNDRIGRLSITIPGHIVEVCNGKWNTASTIYLGSEFVKP